MADSTSGAGKGAAVRAACAALLLAAAAAHVGAAWETPIGTLNDDALYVVLARSLSHGAFAYPDAVAGTPVTDPLPGFSLLLAAPAWAVAPHWTWLRWMVLFSGWGALFFSWRLARALLSETRALAAAVLVAVNPVFLRTAGEILPDMPYLCLSLAGFWFWATKAHRPRRAVLAAALAALAALTRPHGVLLVAALSLMSAAEGDYRAAASLPAGALAPLALWACRNRILTGTPSGYLGNWAAPSRAGAAGTAAHAMRLSRVLFAESFLCVHRLPGTVLALLGLAVVAVCARGARSLLRSRGPAAESRLVDRRLTGFGLAGYTVAVVAAHATWGPVAARYLLPILPFTTILFLAGLPGPDRNAGRAAAIAVGTTLACLAASRDAQYLARHRADFMKPSLWPETMAWIRARVPPGARTESYYAAPITLWTDRPGDNPPYEAKSRDAWLLHALRNETRYVVVPSTIYPEGVFTDAMARFMGHIRPWLDSTPYAVRVYGNPAEGSDVFALRHPDPRRFLEAVAAYQAGKRALQDGRRAFARRELERASRLEPRLAYPWLLLAELAPGRSESAADLANALRADPTSEAVRAAREIARHRWKER